MDSPVTPSPSSESITPAEFPGGPPARLGDSFPVAQRLYEPSPQVLAVGGILSAAAGAAAAGVGGLAWLVEAALFAVAIYLWLVAWIRSADPCDRPDQERERARDHMDRFMGVVDEFAVEPGFKQREWRSLDDRQVREQSPERAEASPDLVEAHDDVIWAPVQLR